MIFSLVHKELRGKYKASVLGFAWTFVNPLLQLAVYTLVFSTILRADIKDYYIFLFVALVPWMFFNSSIVGGSTKVSLIRGDMVKKIYFPREVLPIAYVTSAFVNMILVFYCSVWCLNCFWIWSEFESFNIFTYHYDS